MSPEDAKNIITSAIAEHHPYTRSHFSLTHFADTTAVARRKVLEVTNVTMESSRTAVVQYRWGIEFTQEGIDLMYKALDQRGMGFDSIPEDVKNELASVPEAGRKPAFEKAITVIIEEQTKSIDRVPFLGQVTLRKSYGGWLVDEVES
ncbi:MAG: hypothetical protein IT367_10325 [Candidatus Hydrogenedentes bacterium]|nr:hypothetical protein [Candidatus Hydrogenedentota bacterium]